jgi:hypothetical protein
MNENEHPSDAIIPMRQEIFPLFGAPIVVVAHPDVALARHWPVCATH